MRELGIEIASVKVGEVELRMPFAQRFSTPPNLFPASMVGAVGDMAAVSSCLSLLPEGWAAATLDYTIKMTGQAFGEALIARGRVLQNGRTTSVGAADIVCARDGQEKHCGFVLATTRNFELKL